MSKRSYPFLLTMYVWAWGLYAIAWAAGTFWAVWRWVPRVRYFGKARWTIGARLVRFPETVCEIDPAFHDCNMSLMGSCPADVTRSRVHGVKATIGPFTVAWPRDCDA